MKRTILSLPVGLITFLFGILVAVRFISPTIEPAIEAPIAAANTFEIYLERIEARDENQSNWNINGGYLRMYSSVFLDSNTILSVYSGDGMHISHDGGRSWECLFRPSGFPPATKGFSLSSLEFLDSQIGWASGSCLISTTDGGQTWTNVKLPEWVDNIKVKFFDRDTGYAAGRGGNCERGSSGCTWLSVFKTSDGGKTWSKSFRYEGIDTPWDIVVVDKNVAMVTAGGGWLHRTTNGGRSWKTVLDDGYGRCMSLSRASDGRFWLFGKNSIRVSDDLGKTWVEAPNIDSNILNHEWWSAAFTDTGTGVAVSEDASIVITRDNGRSWKLVPSNLHVNGKIRVPNNPFDEALRGITLSGNKGIILGSQGDYLITIQE